MHKGVVFFVAGDLRLYALEAATGTVLWSKQGCRPYTTPVVGGDGALYVATDDGARGVLWSLDLATGATRWESPAPLGELVLPTEAMDESTRTAYYFGASPATARGEPGLFTSPTLFAVSGWTGQRQQLAAGILHGRARVRLSPTAIDGVAYTGVDATDYSDNTSTAAHYQLAVSRRAFPPVFIYIP